MKDSSCWIEGMFNYTPLYYEVKGIREEVEDLSDNALIDEVSYLCEDNDEIDTIIYNYITKFTFEQKDREVLINFYVLVMIQDYLMVMEDGCY